MLFEYDGKHVVGWVRLYIVNASSHSRNEAMQIQSHGLQLPFAGRSKKNASKSFRYGVKKGSDA